MTYSIMGDGREVGRFISVEIREQEDETIVGRAFAIDHLRDEHGRMRAGALLTMLDMVGGLCGGVASLPDGWVVSTNLAARIVASAVVGPVRLESAVLRRGRNNVVTSARVYDEGGSDALVANGVLTSAILVPENGPPVWERPIAIQTGAGADDSVPPPITDWLGVRPAGAGAIEIDLTDSLRNPWGILHGGVVAMLVDLASERATGAPPNDVVLHFLAPNRTGPVRASVRSLGARADGEVVRVEVHDSGADRVTAVAVATCVTPE